MRCRSATAMVLALAAALLGGVLAHTIAQGQPHQHGTPAPSGTASSPVAPGAAAAKPRTISPDELVTADFDWTVAPR